MTRFTRKHAISTNGKAEELGINNIPGIDVNRNPVLTSDYIYTNLDKLFTNCIIPIQNHFDANGTNIAASPSKNNSNKITLWGDGKATRDFLFVDDASDGIILAAEKYNDVSPINLGAEYEISINDLAIMISKIMKFSGEIIWDTTKGNGQPRRCVSNYKAEKEIGFKPKTSLNDGLEKMITWFESNN